MDYPKLIEKLEALRDDIYDNDDERQQKAWVSLRASDKRLYDDAECETLDQALESQFVVAVPLMMILKTTPAEMIPRGYGGCQYTRSTSWVGWQAEVQMNSSESCSRERRMSTSLSEADNRYFSFSTKTPGGGSCSDSGQWASAPLSPLDFLL